MRLTPVLAAAALLAAAGCGADSGSGGAPAASAPPPAATPVPTPQTITFTETEFKIEPATLTLKPGTYAFQLKDDGKAPHDLHIAPKDSATELAASTQMKAGESTSFQVTLKAGTYTIWCGVGTHRSKGMEGTITVQ